LSRSNLEIVHYSYEAWSRGDLDAALAHMHPEVVWQMAGLFPGIEPRYHGHEGVRRFTADFTEPWETITVEVLDATDLDEERVLAEVRFHGTGKGSGVETTAEFPQIWTFREGLVVHFQSFADRQAADEAATSSG